MTIVTYECPQQQHVCCPIACYCKTRNVEAITTIHDLDSGWCGGCFVVRCRVDSDSDSDGFDGIWEESFSFRIRTQFLLKDNTLCTQVPSGLHIPLPLKSSPSLFWNWSLDCMLPCWLPCYRNGH